MPTQWLGFARMNAHSTAKCVRTKNNYTKKRDMKPMFKLATTAVLATAIGLAPVTRAEANNHNNDALGALVVGGLLAIALADAARRAEAQGTPAPDRRSMSRGPAWRPRRTEAG
jgi:hypothetical protein